jgi:hypothetical protein
MFAVRLFAHPLEVGPPFLKVRINGLLVRHVKRDGAVGLLQAGCQE